MEPSVKSLLIADPRSETVRLYEEMLANGPWDLRTATSGKAAIDLFYTRPPQAVLVRHGMAGSLTQPLIDEIKGDNVYGHVPVVVVLSREELEAGVDWNITRADDCIVEPVDKAELAARVELCLARAQRDVSANPLTALPGNLTITRETERRLASGRHFAFAYLDIDNFKSFNDKYGFSRGDEVLRMTARVIVNAIRSLDSDDTYVGHIGGDDFVWIAPNDLMAEACNRVISGFDLLVGNFYDAEDRERGCIESTDRQGNAVTFPLMSISIGVLDTSVARVQHLAELFERVTEVKSFTKKIDGSSFIIDRRH
jgi:diguanylate cyclase (GGDEF)-like protein